MSEEEPAEVPLVSPLGCGNDLSEPLLPPPPLELSDEVGGGAVTEEGVPETTSNPHGDDARDGRRGGGGGGGGAAAAPLLVAVLVSSLSQFLLGYNTGVMNAPHTVVFPSHGTFVWSVAVASFAVGGAVGAAASGRLADGCGRRGALLITAGIFLLGGLMQTFAPDMAVIVVARFVVGIGSGCASAIGPVYLGELGELAPPALRGAMGTLTQLAIVMGILASDLLAFPFSTEDRWRALFSVTAVLAGIQLALSPVLVESPRWLLRRDAESIEARRIIRKLRGLHDNDEMEAEVEALLVGPSQEGDAEDENEETSDGSDGGGGAWEMLTDPSVRLPVLTALVLPMSQQLCGINAVFYYSTMFFDGVISNPLMGTTLVGTINVLFTILALILMDRCSRRALIMSSSGGMFLSCIAIVLSLLGYFPNIVALTSVNLFVASFELGLGPVPFLIVPEMLGSTKYVATAMSVSLLINWMCNFAVGLAFPYMHEYMGPYSFGPFAAVLMATFVFAWRYLPETAGRGTETARPARVGPEEGLREKLLPGRRGSTEEVQAGMEEEEGHAYDNTIV